VTRGSAGPRPTREPNPSTCQASLHQTLRIRAPRYNLPEPSHNRKRGAHQNAVALNEKNGAFSAYNGP
jgi:hypothetical protein